MFSIYKHKLNKEVKCTDYNTGISLLWNSGMYEVLLCPLVLLCLISRTTVTSLTASKDKRCQTQHLCASPGIPFWTCESYTRNNKRVILYHALTSQSFSRWDKVIVTVSQSHRMNMHPILVISKNTSTLVLPLKIRH